MLIVGRVKGVTQGVDGLELKAESDVGVDADAGVTQQLLEHDELDARFQEPGRGQVPQVVEADASESGTV